METTSASSIQLWGAGCFGAIIGWYVYYINRYRKGEVQLGDLVTLIGAIGGAAILALFDKKTDLFGAYGIGLAAGFFGYFVTLLVMVGMASKIGTFKFDWFLDGRRKNPEPGWGYPGNEQPRGGMGGGGGGGAGGAGGGAGGSSGPIGS